MKSLKGRENERSFYFREKVTEVLYKKVTFEWRQSNHVCLTFPRGQGRILRLEVVRGVLWQHDIDMTQMFLELHAIFLTLQAGSVLSA